jgi:O-acetylhomoserine/O-acetylserine sulfhydrylase-like pyridoxal-dependent enzyme
MRHVVRICRPITATSTMTTIRPLSSKASSSSSTPLSFDTVAARHYDIDPRALAGLSLPIVTATTYRMDDASHGARLAMKDESPISDTHDGYIYARWGNPTALAVGNAISQLENAKAGTYITSSGMAAITTSLLTTLKSGDHVISPSAVYGGTSEWFSTFAPRLGIDVTFIDPSNIQNYANSIKPNTKVLYAETPANPTLRLIDMTKLGQLSRRYGDIIDCIYQHSALTVGYE